MNERIIQFRVGVVVLATCIIAVILVLAFQDKRPFGPGTYHVHVPFDRAPGIRVGTPVRKSGIRIGEVSDIKLQDTGGVVVTLAIDSRFRLFRTERAQITTSNILGDAVIEFVPDPALHKRTVQVNGQQAKILLAQQPTDEAAIPNNIVEPDETLKPGIVQVNPLELLTDLQGDLRTAIGSFTLAGDSLRGASTEVQSLAATVNGFLQKNRGQLNNILSKTELAMDDFSKTMRSVNLIIGDQEVALELRRGLLELPKLMSDTRSTIASIKRAADEAGGAMENLGGFTAALDEHGSPILASFHSRIEQLGELLDQLTQFGESINGSQGTIGLLLNDPELYDSLKRAAGNIEDASTKLRPILDDVRIFSDKIARDPGRIGVSGAIRGRSVTK